MLLRSCLGFIHVSPRTMIIFLVGLLIDLVMSHRTWIISIEIIALNSRRIGKFEAPTRIVDG